jgi:hemoglobin
MTEPSFFERLGGEPVLRRIVDRFVDRVFDDPMIGFFFGNASRERIKEKEYEFAARHLGADVPYTGKPIRDAHAPHGIMGGQFMRRLKILEDTLTDLGVAEDITRHWLEQNEKLRPLVTRDAGSHCDGQEPDDDS